MFKKAKEFGDEKVSIAIQTYEMVDKHIRRLDGDLAKFEAEMREKGRLSQTETESEAEADDDNGDDTSNKKGPKKGRKTPGKTPTTGSNANKKRPKVLLKMYSGVIVIFYYRFRAKGAKNFSFLNHVIQFSDCRKRRQKGQKAKERGNLK